MAGRRADRRVPGRLHAVRAGPDEGGEARARPGARPPRRRHPAPVQARGQAGLRQGARAVADRLPRGAPGPPPGVGRVPPRPGPEAGRGAGEALGKGVRGSGRGALGPDGRPRRPLRLGGAGARRGRRARGPPDPAPRGAPAPVVARGPASLRRHADAHRREGRGPRELVLRPPEARGREARRPRPPVRVAQRETRLPPDGPRPVLEPGRLLDLAHRRGDARGGADRAAAGAQHDQDPRQGRGAAQALLGGPAGRPGHGGRAEQLGRARRGDAQGVGDGPARHGAPRLQPPVHLLVGALQRAVGPADEGRGREGFLAPGDAGVGREVLRPREGARPDPPRRGQLAVLRRGPRQDGPQLVAPVPARVEVEGRARRGRGADVPRLDVELRGRAPAGRGAHAQQRVRQRLGLRGLDRRRGLELRLPRHDGRAPAPPQGRGVALHRAPRRDQRVERLRARRPLGEGDRPRGPGAGDDAARLARAPVRRGGLRSRRRRRSRARRCRCRCGPRS